MIHQTLIIQNKLGLHTRAAAKLVATAKKYLSSITIVFRDRKVDAKSIMGVITLGAQKNQAVEIIIDGKDEQAAFEAIQQLLDQKFGEE